MSWRAITVYGLVRATWLMGLIAVGVLLATIQSPTSQASEQKKDASGVKDMSLRIRSIESYVVEKLKNDEAMWVSPGRTKEALELITLASSLRSPDTVKPLLLHIEYTKDWAPLLLEAMYPVVGCLIAIGTPAVEPLIELIKSSPDIREDVVRRAADGSVHLPRRRDLVVSLAVHALSKIFDHPSGHGKNICRLVLEAELKKAAVDSEREGLRAALKVLQR